MLVLNRKRHEAIQIGDNIEVKVLAVEGEQVKIGISAPKNVGIYRKEIYLDIKNQNAEAANITTDVIAMLQQNADD
ncbi:carbon storage regulator CsrA [Virgibacillus halophilus]|uniref:carbon storage regulator CsrA n=1 Tax=Tigheibacillus halophilus TaxID=361280 RepID=UPI00362CD359